MFGGLSPAKRAEGPPDDQRDDRDDLRTDQISAYILGEGRRGSTRGLGPTGDGDDEDGEEFVDPVDALDAEAHWKKMEGWKLSSKRREDRAAHVREERPSLTTLHTDTMLLRNCAIANAVWTLGDNTHGQCGHSSTAPEPHPVPLELQVLRDGVRSLHAGPYCTVLVTMNGDAIGFGSGPFRAATDTPSTPQARAHASNAYDGAPPFRVSTFKGFGPIGGAAASALTDEEESAKASEAWLLGMAGGGGRSLFGTTQPPSSSSMSTALTTCNAGGRAGEASTSAGGGSSGGAAAEAAAATVAARAKSDGRTEDGGSARSNVSMLLDMLMGRGLQQYGEMVRPSGGVAFESTTDLVHASMARRATELATPLPLRQMLMPVASIAMGDDFCVALMQNGLVFSWGDGEEGKLGLGHTESKDRPTMIDSLMPTAYAAVAKKSDKKDELFQAGARLIKTRGKEFQVVSLACGARHTMALTTSTELFTWGSGCCGQLGHGSKHDELLPRPVMNLHKKKAVRASAIAVGSYHSMAIIGFSRSEREPPQLWAWGDGAQGRLGLGDDTNRTIPNEVHYHRIVPRKRVDIDGQDDRTTGGLLNMRFRGDWMCSETGHPLEWASIACGGYAVTMPL